MSHGFGAAVAEKAKMLSAQGKDANQIAKIVCDEDAEGYNYGIGILLDGTGKAWPTSPTALEYTRKELEHSGRGDYMNSAGLMGALKEAVLAWQRIPQDLWDRFHLLIPSDAGTGAVQASINMALALDDSLRGIAVETLSWPAYRVIARIARTDFREFPIGGVMEEPGILPVYQAGPMNTTGRVQEARTVTDRAKAAGEMRRPVLLDRAYSGFEYARLVDSHSYDTIMRMSFDTQIRPFFESETPFWVAISPTKAFVTFSLRPCGFVLYYTPEHAQHGTVTTLANGIMRARGSSFEHPVTRAFAKALVNDTARLEMEHHAVLRRLAEAEHLWKQISVGTPLSGLFSDAYAGLFRNAQHVNGAEEAVYDAHLYPVFGNGRCRLNVTGIPHDKSIAQQHVSVFAAHLS